MKKKDTESILILGCLSIIIFTVIEQDRSCVVSASAKPLNIRYSTGTTVNCGTRTHPWQIEAPSGQQIQLNLLDLSYGIQDLASERLHSCHHYGYVIDDSSKNNISSCELQNQRKKIIYQSTSHVIKIIFTTGTPIGHNQEVPKILLGFKG